MLHALSTQSRRRPPFARVKRPLRLLASAWMIGTAAAALAQEDETAAPASAASAEMTVPAKAASGTPPAVAPAQVGKLKPDEQVRWLRHAAQTGELEKLDDAELVALFKSLDPLTVPRYVKDGPNGYPSYEFTMLRQERIRGTWPERPDHMLVRVTRDPLRIYAKWLPDGAHAGQEIIYDETKRSDKMYGHLGGILNIIPVWASLNGPLARAQSNHLIRDLGIEYIATQFLSEGTKYAQAGRHAAEPDRSENARRRARHRIHVRDGRRHARVLCKEGNARPRSAASVFPERRVVRQRRANLRANRVPDHHAENVR